jgi:hypothetical protein
LPETFDDQLVDCTMELNDIFAAGRNRTLAHFASELYGAALDLVESPSPKSMGAMLSHFLNLLVNYRETLRQEPGCIFWRLATQYADVAGNLSQPAPAENQSFEHLPRMLASLSWVTDFLVRLAQAADLSPGQRDQLAEFSPKAARRLAERAERLPEGAFLNLSLRLQRALENRLRQVWLLQQFRDSDPGAIELYATAHSGLFPAFQPAADKARTEAEMHRLHAAAQPLDLADVAECLANPEWLAQYCLLHFMPPDPGAFPPRFMIHYDRLLHGRVARWYTYPFFYVLSPMEITATVLRLGRPLFYERAVAHALLEYSLLQSVAFDSGRLGHYLDTVRVLDFQFQMFFEGYLLRLVSYPKLKEPRGWCEYLDSLQRLHHGEVPLPELHPFRREFLRARGLAAADELLCRLSGSQGALQ